MVVVIVTHNSPMTSCTLTLTTLTRSQKLLHNIQMKEQQKILEAQLVSMATQQLTSIPNPDILSALKAMQEAGTSKEAKQGTTATVFTAPSGVPDHIANSLSGGRK